MVLTPDGRLARYLFGIEYGPRDLRLALVDAADGQDRHGGRSALLYCYHYDPTTRPIRPGDHERRPRSAAPLTRRSASSDFMVLTRCVRAAAPGQRGGRQHGSHWMSSPAPPVSAQRVLGRHARWTCSTLPPARSARSSSLLIVGARSSYFAVKYRRRVAGRGRRRHPRVALLELTWTVIPLVLSMVMFVWGASVFFAARRGRPTTRWTSTSSASSGCGRSSTPTASARSTSCTCRSAGRCKLIDDLGGRDPRLLVPAFRVKHGRRAGPLHDMWFQATEAGTYHLFCAEYCGTRHSGMIGEVYVMEPDDVPAVARAAARRQDRCSSRREAVQRARRASPATSPTRTGRGPSLDGLFGRHGACSRTADRSSPTRIHPRVDPEPAGEDRRRVTSRSCRPSRAR